MKGIEDCIKEITRTTISNYEKKLLALKEGIKEYN